MGLFIVSLVFAFAVAVCLVISRIGQRAEEKAQSALDRGDARAVKTGFRIGAIVFALGAVICFVVSILAFVGTKEEGVVTSFGKPTGRMSNGLHFKAPWQSVHEMDAAIQTDTYKGKDCLQVRIANQQTGCADISIQWRIQKDAVDYLYQNYRSFEHVRDALVTRNLTSAVNQAFSNYNPLDAIVNGSGSSTPSNGVSNKTLSQVAKSIRTIMRSEIGSRISVLSVILPYMSFDQATQDRINQLQQQVALTRIAEQQRKTNVAQALANQALAKSVDTSPNVLVSQCIGVLEAMVKQHETVPAGFSCWPGGSNIGVIAGSGK